MFHPNTLHTFTCLRLNFLEASEESRFDFLSSQGVVEFPHLVLACCCSINFVVGLFMDHFLLSHFICYWHH